MTTILLIDDDTGVFEFVRDALPECQVIYAPDGILGLDIFRAKPDTFDLILLDNNMPNLDGRDTLLKIRELSKTIPICLYTGYHDSLMFHLVRELSGTTPLMKNLRASELAREIRATLGTAPIIQPGEAVLAYAQHMSGDRETVGRATQGRLVCVLAESRAVQGGIRMLLEASGVKVSLMFVRVDELRNTAQKWNIIAAVSSKMFHKAISVSVPIICVALTLKEALMTLDAAENALGPVAIVVDNPSQPLWVSECIQEAFVYLERGLSYRIDHLEHPFHRHTRLTLPDKDYLELEARGLTTDQIAERLDIEVSSVRTIRKRVRQRLGLDVETSLQDWAEQWWATHYLAQSLPDY